MSLSSKISRIASGAFLAVLLLGTTAGAQIASYVDASGKLIYTNDDSQGDSQGSGMTSPLAQIRALVGSRRGTGGQVGAGPEAQTVDPELDQIVQNAAERHDLDPALVKAVISTESGWNTRAISQKGAMGLMQLIPSTAQRFGVGNPFDPAQNIEGGTSYLKILLDRYNGDLTKSLAAYNAGEHAVDLSRGVPAYPETQRYVQKVTKAYFRPGSGRTSTKWTPPKPPVRREIGADGRVVFTNE
ncbi:MAG TPA: lytic transglycosylase domain-containing protein [Candidatus Acidoferrales bacterium]|jgi:hypothetical protein|nr:lytic transglycosylase domain-containing protein [Candidatus Acidoferrales bacterium]